MSQPRLRELAEVVLVNTQGGRIPQHEDDLSLIEPAIHERHDGEEADRVLGERLVREGAGQLRRRGRRQAIDIQSIAALEQVPVGRAERGAVGGAERRGSGRARHPAHRAENGPGLIGRRVNDHDGEGTTL